MAHREVKTSHTNKDHRTTRVFAREDEFPGESVTVGEAQDDEDQPRIVDTIRFGTDTKALPERELAVARMAASAARLREAINLTGTDQHKVGLVASLALCIIVVVVAGSSSAKTFMVLVPVLHPTLLFLVPYQLGLLAFLDSTGRVAAAAPAFLTFGAAIGPFVGGVALGGFGMASLGWVAAIGFVIGTALFLPTARRSDTIRAKDA